MPFLFRLFGKSESKDPEPVLHKDCRIYPAPVKEAGGYRVAARIEKEIAGVVKVHKLGRADTFASMDEAQEVSLAKAKTAINQLGDTLFN